MPTACGVLESKMNDVEMYEVGRDNVYIFWQGNDGERMVYNITPIGGYKPTGGYYNQQYILGLKHRQINLFK